MSKINEIWSWVSLWVSRKIRSPFSNFATKFALIVGGSIVVSPIIEHLILNAILKHWLNIDLKIEVPDLNAYIFGSALIVCSLIHNLLYLKLTNKHEAEIKDIENSTYKKLWGYLDDVIDDTARLNKLYTKHYDKSFDEYVLNAEQSVITCSSFLRKNRPFFFSEELYAMCSEICRVAYQISQEYHVCLKAQKYEAGVLTAAEVGDFSVEKILKDFNYSAAQKELYELYRSAKDDYEHICSEIRQHINSI